MTVMICFLKVWKGEFFTGYKFAKMFIKGFEVLTIIIWSDQL